MDWDYCHTPGCQNRARRRRGKSCSTCTGRRFRENHPNWMPEWRAAHREQERLRCQASYYKNWEKRKRYREWYYAMHREEQNEKSRLRMARLREARKAQGCLHHEGQSPNLVPTPGPKETPDG